MGNLITIYYFKSSLTAELLGSIVVSIPACHAGDRGSIPRRGEHIFFFKFWFTQHSAEAIVSLCIINNLNCARFLNEIFISLPVSLLMKRGRGNPDFI